MAVLVSFETHVFSMSVWSESINEFLESHHPFPHPFAASV